MPIFQTPAFSLAQAKSLILNLNSHLLQLILHLQAGQHNASP